LTYECKFCASLRNKERNYEIDSVRTIEIEYYCGTILKVIFPAGDYEWIMYCAGSSSKSLEKIRKLPDK